MKSYNSLYGQRVNNERRRNTAFIRMHQNSSMVTRPCYGKRNISWTMTANHFTEQSAIEFTPWNHWSDTRIVHGARQECKSRYGLSVYDVGNSRSSQDSRFSEGTQDMKSSNSESWSARRVSKKVCRSTGKGVVYGRLSLSLFHLRDCQNKSEEAKWRYWWPHIYRPRTARPQRRNT